MRIIKVHDSSKGLQEAFAEIDKAIENGEKVLGFDTSEITSMDAFLVRAVLQREFRLAYRRRNDDKV